MKKITIPILLLAVIGLASCKKWLDVKPEAQTTKDELFTTEKGFRDALTGTYIHLKSGDTYGGACMWGNIEFMARTWDPLSNSNSGLVNLGNANYSDAVARGWLDNMYSGLYKVVADANSILENIDAKKQIFTNNNYPLIKGESLILRAFAHFDVLRLFGPMPNNPGTAPILPYVKAVTKEISPLLTYEQFIQQLLADVDQAEALMKDVDPIAYYSMLELNPIEGWNTPPIMDDDFYMYRQIRMNYYAALALKARIYTWLSVSNDIYKTNAATYARMVVEAKSHDGNPTFRLGKASDAGLGDYTMSPEHIAALSIYNLTDIAQNTFGDNGVLGRNDFNIQDGYYYLNNLFPVAERSTDIRFLNMWAYRNSAPTNYVINKKFIQKPNQAILQVPLMRLSEMYLILTECAATKTEAEGYYRFFCDQKGVPFANGFNNADWQTDRRNKIIREYARELFAEGQSFYTYKRYNVTTLPAQWTYTYFNGNAARYVVPKPDREINYQNK